MTDQTVDNLGRPVVVVTGMGVLTSLGEGKAENWRKLLAGVSGIHRISRFPIAGLRTTVAGTIDFISVDEPSAPALTEAVGALAANEAIAESGIGAPADFPGPLLLAMPPVEMEWPQRLAAAAAASGRTCRSAGWTWCAPSATAGFARWHERFLFGSVAEHLAVRFGTKGLADRHLHRLRLRRHGDPACRGGNPPRRVAEPRWQSAPTPRSIRRA